MCAYHWKGPSKLNDQSLYPDAEKGGACDQDDPEAFYPCFGPHPYPNTSNPDTSAGSAGNTNGSSSGEPTTGNDQPKSYLCTTAPEERFFYWRYGTETEAEAIALGSLRKESWGEPADLPKVYCAYGTLSQAIDACVAKCKTDWEIRVDGLTGNKAYIWGASDNWGPDQPDANDPTAYSSTGDCDALTNMVIEEVAPYSCIGQGAILPAWDGVTPFKKFLATVMFTGTDRGSSSQTDLRGYLSFKVENCTSTSCDLGILALELSSQDLTGFYTSPDGSQSSYSLDNLELRTTQQIWGQLYLSRGTIVFPTSVAKGNVWVHALTIDGVNFGATSSLFDVEQISGTYRDNHLSLSFTQVQGDTVLSMTLETE